MGKFFRQSALFLSAAGLWLVVSGCKIHSARRPEIQVDPAVLVVFGRQAVGTSASRPVVVHNVGRAALHVRDVFLESGNLPEEQRVFELEFAGPAPSDDAPWILQPGETLEFHVWYTPQLRQEAQSDQDTDRLHIVSDEPDPGRADYRLDVLSSNTGAMLGGVPAEVDFCLVDGRQGPVAVTLSNQGTEPTYVDSVSVSGGTEFGVALLSDATAVQEVNPALNLDVGESFTVYVWCNPTGAVGDTGRAILRARVCSGGNNQACVTADNLVRLYAPAWADAGFEVTTTPLPPLPVRLTGRLSRSFGNTVTRYRWSIVEFPAGSLTAEWFNRGEEQDPEYEEAPSCPAGQNRAADPCFIPDVPGPYRFRLEVDDERPVCELSGPGAACVDPNQCCSFVCEQQYCGGCRPAGAPCSAHDQCCTAMCGTDQTCQLCLAVGQTCASDTECCSRLCYQNTCAGCLGPSSPCDEAYPQACCTGTCEGSMCAVCLDDGQSCERSEQCCSHVCAGGTCGGCLAYGESCSDNGDCCSDNCNAADQCQPCEGSVCFDHSWSCRLEGEPCAHSSECCTSVCDPGTGTCASGTCLGYRSPCAVDRQCCSGYCHPVSGLCEGACGVAGGCMCSSTNPAETVVRAFGEGLTVYLTWNGTGDMDLHLMSAIPDRLCSASHEMCVTSADCTANTCDMVSNRCTLNNLFCDDPADCVNVCTEADLWRSYGDCYWANAHPDWGNPRVHNGTVCNSSFDCLNDPNSSEQFPDCIDFGNENYCTDTLDDPRLAKDENKQFGPEVIKLKEPVHGPSPPYDCNIYHIGVHFFPAGIVTAGTRTATLQVFYLGQEVFADISPGFPLSRSGLQETHFWNVGYLTICSGSIVFTGQDTVCGNQVVDAGEDCDDNNNSDWDGCRDCLAVEFRVNTRITQDQRAADVAVSGDNRWVAVWQSFGQDNSGEGIYGQLYNAQGLSSGGEFRVNSTTVGDQQAPAVAMDGDGDFVVVWQGPDADLAGIFGQRYNAAGTAQGAEFPVNATTAGSQERPDVAMAQVAAGPFVVVWQGPDAGGSGVWARPYDAAGNPGAETAVNATSAGDQNAPAVGMDSSGNFVVVWQGPDADGTGVFARRFDSSGGALGGEIAVNTTTAGDQGSPAVKVLSSGGFIVSWQAPDGAGTGVFVRIFDASGGVLSTELAVNETSADNQGLPAVGAASNGDFVVAWHSYGQDLSGGGIYGRRFDASGNPTASEFPVNEYMNNDQVLPAIALGGDGRLVVIWQSQGQDSSAFGVFAQRYDATGQALGVRPW